jgi:glucose/arabinose dehydrogenase
VHDGHTHVFMDLRNRVNDLSDRGLISLALDPDFETNRHLYLLFTHELHPGKPDKDTPAAGELIRVDVSKSDPPRPKPGSEKVLLSDFKNKGIWHSVAGMVFDWRGRLIVGLGDGHMYYPADLGPEALVAQDVDELNGKIVRLDPETGSGVPENPFFDPEHPNSVRSRVIAYGVREPFRVRVDAARKRIYFGDVGSDHWEEIDVIPPSVEDPRLDLNFGWPCYEGAVGEAYRLRTFKRSSTCEELYARKHHGAVLPAFSYPRTGGAAIVLGPLYRNGPYPDSYDGRFFVGDFSKNSVRTYDGSTDAADFGERDGWGNPVDFELTPSGTMAYAAIGDGRIVEITYAGSGNARAIALAIAGAAAILMLAIAAWLLLRRTHDRDERAPAPEALPASPPVDPLMAGVLVNLERRRDFRLHVFAYVIWSLFLVAVWAVSEHERTNTWPRPFNDPAARTSWTLWIVYPVLGWGLILALHALVVYRRPVSAQDVEAELRRLRPDA